MNWQRKARGTCGEGRAGSGARQSWLRRTLGRAAGAVAAIAVACAAAAPASAFETLTLSRAVSGDYYTYTYDGLTSGLGLIGRDENGNIYYCIENAIRTDYTVTGISDLPDTVENRQIAWALEQYSGKGNPNDEGALAIIVHDAFDVTEGDHDWATERAYLETAAPHLFVRAEAMLRKAAAAVPSDLKISMGYADGHRSGTVTLKMTNAAGDYVSGSSYTVRLNGPATFSNGSKQVSGVANGTAINVNWVATGEGDVSATVEMPVGTLQRATSQQDLVRLGPGTMAASTPLTFPVKKTFAPAIGTVTSPKVLDPGATVSDDVTVTLGDAADSWPGGVTLDATGWYFDGLASDQIGAAVEPSPCEPAASFVSRLEGLGYKVAAYGSASFGAAGESKAVTAVTGGFDGEEPYVVGDEGAFGTWVWAIERDRQSSDAAQYLACDVVSGFLEPDETNVHRAKLNVSSTVTEHTARVGSEMTDTIVVDGFPDNHGSFEGSETLGIGGDEPLAQVSVYWAAADAKPDTEEVPDDVVDVSGGGADSGVDDGGAADGSDDGSTDGSVDNDDADSGTGDDGTDDGTDGGEVKRKLVGTWDYPAVNGTIRVGGGIADAHGDPVTIEAEEAGWYVFVYSFGGDDRVMPYASAYNDAWERVRVIGPDEPEPGPDEELEESEPPVTPASFDEPETPQADEEAAAPTPLAQTGMAFGALMAIALALACAGAVLLAAAHGKTPRSWIAWMPGFGRGDVKTAAEAVAAGPPSAFRAASWNWASSSGGSAGTQGLGAA